MIAVLFRLPIIPASIPPSAQAGKEPTKTAMITITGRSAFLRLLVEEGVDTLFAIRHHRAGNHEALGSHPELRYVLGLQEAVVVAMADGYARASNRMLPAMHVAPGRQRYGFPVQRQVLRPLVLITAPAGAGLRPDEIDVVYRWWIAESMASAGGRGNAAAGSPHRAARRERRQRRPGPGSSACLATFSTMNPSRPRQVDTRMPLRALRRLASLCGC